MGRTTENEEQNQKEKSIECNVVPKCKGMECLPQAETQRQHKNGTGVPGQGGGRACVLFCFEGKRGRRRRREGEGGGARARAKAPCARVQVVQKHAACRRLLFSVAWGRK